MKYKRVTEYQENTRARIIEPLTLQGIIDYLAELEDKIERGELIEVPQGADSISNPKTGEKWTFGKEG